MVGSGSKAGAAVLVLALVLTACGEGKPDRPPPRPATSPEQFAKRFDRLTGVHLTPAADPFGERLKMADEPDRFARFGAYSLVWTATAHDRRVVLGRGRADARGIYWERVGEGWSANKAFGPRLALSWVGEHTRKTTPKWDRLERAVRAAYLGKPQLLPAAERPCRDARLDPLHGRSGACSVDGIPVTFGDADEALSTPALDARVLGVKTTGKVGESGLLPQAAKGRFIVIAYRVRNTTSRRIRFLRSHLRLDGRTLVEDAGASVSLPRSRGFPLPPGATLESEAAFDVAPSLARRARREGAFVLPSAIDDLEDPAPDLAQGWIRLSRAPGRLPPPPKQRPAPGSPPPPPEPKGPPPIHVTRGSGPPIGGTTRRLYTANTYFPIPKSFVAGGVRTGTRAGDCRVPRPSRRDRAELHAAARRETPKGRVSRPLDRQILLADCGSKGRWALLTWIQGGGRRGPVIHVDELVRRGGRWVGTPRGTPPGCRLPEEAAAAWQIDISVCESARGGKGARPPRPLPRRGQPADGPRAEPAWTLTSRSWPARYRSAGPCASRWCWPAWHSLAAGVGTVRTQGPAVPPAAGTRAEAETTEAIPSPRMSRRSSRSAFAA
jgi:hypothetical protein